MNARTNTDWFAQNHTKGERPNPKQAPENAFTIDNLISTIEVTQIP